MRIQMEPSGKVVLLDGVLCRVWYGRTERDTPCIVLVREIVGADPRFYTDWEKEILEPGAASACGRE